MGKDVGKAGIGNWCRWIVIREEGSIHNPILLESGKEGILIRRAAFPLTRMTDRFCWRWDTAISSSSPGLGGSNLLHLLGSLSMPAT